MEGVYLCVKQLVMGMFGDGSYEEINGGYALKKRYTGHSRPTNEINTI